MKMLPYFCVQLRLVATMANPITQFWNAMMRKSDEHILLLFVFFFFLLQVYRDRRHFLRQFTSVGNYETHAVAFKE